MRKTLSTALLCFSVSCLSAQQYQWTTKAAMRMPRTNMACAVLNDTIYAFGGNAGAANGSSGASNAAEAFNVKTNTWRVLPSMPTPRLEMSAEQVGGKLYVMGGYDVTNGGSLSDLEIYDPATNTWSTGAPMPGPRSQFVSCAIGNKIYVTGGWPNSYADLFIYDVATNTWTSSGNALMTYGVMQCNSGVAANGKFYVLAGRYGQTLVDYNQVYDPASNTWTTQANTPIPVFEGAATLYHNKIHLLGGGSDWQAQAYYYDTHFAYDPVTNTWAGDTTLPVPLANQSAVTVHDTLYMIGGKTTASGGTVSYSSNQVYAYGPVPQPSAVNNLAAEKIASFYPNPAGNEVHISLVKNSGAEKNILLRDYAGKTVFTTSFSGNAAEINTSNIPSGIYLLTVVDGSNASTEKLVIVH